MCTYSEKKLLCFVIIFTNSIIILFFCLGLFHDSASLSYRVAPPVPARPTVTNIAACR